MRQTGTHRDGVAWRGRLFRPVPAFLLILFAGCVTPPTPPKPVAGSADSILQDPVRVTYNEAALQPVGDVLRLCTYNIQDLTDGENDGYTRTAAVVQRHIEAAARIINEIRADILFLEEVENAAIVNRLAALIDPPYPEVYVTDFNEDSRGTKRNIAALSRHRILKIRELDFATADAPVPVPRGALALAVDLGEKQMLLAYGVHLKSNFGKKEGKDASNIAKRQEALKLVRAHAELVMEANPSHTWHIVVAGDMNVDPELPDFQSDASLAPLSDWHDLWLGRPLEERITIPTRYGDPQLEFPSACFDRIIVSPALVETPWRVKRIEVLQRGVDTENVYSHVGENEIHASDHYAVYVDIER